MLEVKPIIEDGKIYLTLNGVKQDDGMTLEDAEKKGITYHDGEFCFDGVGIDINVKNCTARFVFYKLMGELFEISESNVNPEIIESIDRHGQRYYEIKYFDKKINDHTIGFGSYDRANCERWIKEYFL